jgi:hypothetical protein
MSARYYEEFKGNLTNKIRKGGKQVDIDTPDVHSRMRMCGVGAVFICIALHSGDGMSSGRAAMGMM